MEYIKKKDYEKLNNAFSYYDSLGQSDNRMPRR